MLPLSSLLSALFCAYIICVSGEHVERMRDELAIVEARLATIKDHLEGFLNLRYLTVLRLASTKDINSEEGTLLISLSTNVAIIATHQAAITIEVSKKLVAIFETYILDEKLDQSSEVVFRFARLMISYAECAMRRFAVARNLSLFLETGALIMTYVSDDKSSLELREYARFIVKWRQKLKQRLARADSEFEQEMRDFLLSLADLSQQEQSSIASKFGGNLEDRAIAAYLHDLMKVNDLQRTETYIQWIDEIGMRGILVVYAAQAERLVGGIPEEHYTGQVDFFERMESTFADFELEGADLFDTSLVEIDEQVSIALERLVQQSIKESSKPTKDKMAASVYKIVTATSEMKKKSGIELQIAQKVCTDTRLFVELERTKRKSEIKKLMAEICQFVFSEFFIESGIISRLRTMYVDFFERVLGKKQYSIVDTRPLWKAPFGELQIPVNMANVFEVYVYFATIDARIHLNHDLWLPRLVELKRLIRLECRSPQVKFPNLISFVMRYDGFYNIICQNHLVFAALMKSHLTNFLEVTEPNSLSYFVAMSQNSLITWCRYMLGVLPRTEWPWATFDVLLYKQMEGSFPGVFGVSNLVTDENGSRFVK